MSSPIIHQFSASMISPSPNTDHVTPLYIVFHASLLHVKPSERPSGLHPGKAGTTMSGYLPPSHGFLSLSHSLGPPTRKSRAQHPGLPSQFLPLSPSAASPSLQLLPSSAYLTPTHLLRLSSDTGPSGTHLDASLPSL